jgi:hypothetical protein
LNRASKSLYEAIRSRHSGFGFRPVCWECRSISENLTDTRKFQVSRYLKFVDEFVSVDCFGLKPLHGGRWSSLLISSQGHEGATGRSD